MTSPILRIDGRNENQDSGTTLADIRVTYPGCYVVNGDNAHRSSTFVLQDGITYELKQANAGKYGFQ
jgi:hypothetical protein